VTSLPPPSSQQARRASTDHVGAAVAGVVDERRGHGGEDAAAELWPGSQSACWRSSCID